MSGRRVGLLVNYLMGEYTNNIGAGIGIGIGNHESTNETISEIIFDIVKSIQVQIRNSTSFYGFSLSSNRRISFLSQFDAL